MSRVIVLNDLINFEPEKKCLNSRDSQVHISAPASYCFQLLIEKQGELVTHEEFYQYAWRQFGMEATANTLYQNISLIRRGLDACGLHEDIIRTMPRRGFILSPAVKIQYTRTRDLVAEQQAVQGFADKPEQTLPTETHLVQQSDQHPDSTEHELTVMPETVETATPIRRETSLADAAIQAPKAREQKHIFEQSPKSLFKLPRWNVQWLTHLASYLLGIIAFLSIVYLIFSLNFNQHLKSINYVYLTRYNDCEYYVNRDGENDQRSISLITKMQQHCPFGKYNYLTKYTGGGYISIIKCRKPLDYLHGTLCSSEYIMGSFEDNDD